MSSRWPASRAAHSRNSALLGAAFLGAVLLTAAAAPSHAQGRQPGLDPSLRALGDLGVVAPVQAPPSALRSWNPGGRYGAPEALGRMPERPLPHMPPAPLSDWRR